MATAASESIVWFDQPEPADVAHVGGKNASLAEVTRTLAGAGIRVPPGFATTAAMYRGYIKSGSLAPQIRQNLDEYHSGKQSLPAAGAAIRRLITDAEFPGADAECDTRRLSGSGAAQRNRGSCGGGSQ